MRFNKLFAAALIYTIVIWCAIIVVIYVETR